MGLDIEFIEVRPKHEEAREIAYFRKVNFLVGFFERYGDVENCENFRVSYDMIETLKFYCEIVSQLQDRESAIRAAEEFLPTASGIFFGSTEYDDRYFDNVKEVLQVCNEMLDNWKDDSEYYFCADW